MTESAPPPEALTRMVMDFVRSHLRDLDLSARMIADNLGVSTAQIRDLSSSTQFDLDRWIVAERLRLAHHTLARQASGWHPEQSRRWGFGNTSDFIEEFTAAYGVSPRDWQRISAEERRADRPSDERR
ncbi:helix-turn-helix domain-containing protein [Gordonia sp. PKS22-38]|uniref:Helix-turn-helix domain-containing protein n=1 Tax=Gordonia prachuapensis TaxID=3115651 RepID=A0ABU7MYF0_9ACTN|nr:helix-turn-helix domain-containing protein [Gordonia sp. PKS22-38]